MHVVGHGPTAQLLLPAPKLSAQHLTEELTTTNIQMNADQGKKEKKGTFNQETSN